MLIKNKCSLNLYLLISLILLVFTQISIKLLNYNNASKNEAIETQICFLELPQNYYFSNEFYFFKVDYATASLFNKKNNIGYIFSIVGRMDASTANEFFAKKRIDVQEITFQKDNITSVKAWICKIRGVCFLLKKSLELRLMRLLSFSNSNLVLRMIFGKDQNQTPDLDHFFKVTGMQHVAAVSGFNVSLIGGLIFTLTHDFKGFKRVFLWWVVVTFYIFLTDLSAAVLRAYGMAILNVLITQLSGKTYSNLYSLVMASLLLLLFNPFLVINVSFQLSFLASLGLSLFGPFLKLNDGGLLSLSSGQVVTTVSQVSNWGQKIKNVLSESFWTTLMAQSFALPWILFVFGEFTLVSIWANTFLLWLTPIITILGVWMVVLVSFLPLSIGQILVWPINYLLNIFRWGLAWFGQFEGLLLTDLQFTWKFLIASWGGVLILWLYLKNKSYEKQSPQGTFNSCLDSISGVT
jgi:ComEC/Rec2-related protein